MGIVNLASELNSCLPIEDGVAERDQGHSTNSYKVNTFSYMFLFLPKVFKMPTMIFFQ